MLRQATGRTPAQAIAARVARLFLRFPSSRLTDATAEATVAAYAQDLEPFPLWAIDQAMMAAIQKGGAFAPSSPELRKACDQAVAETRTEAADIFAVLSAEVYHEPTAEERAKSRAKFDALISELELMAPNDRWRLRPAGSRPLSSVTPAEATDALEAMKADPQPAPPLSDALRAKMGLLRDQAAE